MRSGRSARRKGASAADTARWHRGLYRFRTRRGWAIGGQLATRHQPFVVELGDFPGKQFMDIQHVNGQVIIRLSIRHRFYRETWEPLKEIADPRPEACCYLRRSPSPDESLIMPNTCPTPAPL
jgi:hypothetical protein